MSGSSTIANRTRLSTSVEPIKNSWNSSVRWSHPNNNKINKLINNNNNYPKTFSSSSSCVIRPISLNLSNNNCLKQQNGYTNSSNNILRSSQQSERSSRSSFSSNNNLKNITKSSNLSSSICSEGRSFSPRNELKRKTFPYRTKTTDLLSQTRTTLINNNYNNLYPKRQQLLEINKLNNSLNEITRTSTTLISPSISKCVSPLSMSSSISRSPSIAASSISPNSSNILISPHKPIPKSERPWRQKLADSQKFREARETERSLSVGYYNNNKYNNPTIKLMAARSARRILNNEHINNNNINNEKELEKEIAALKCYVSKPGALDKNATIAKFRQTMAESRQVLNEQPSSSSLLLKMPSLNRRFTTEITKKELLNNEKEKKERPLSLIETTKINNNNLNNNNENNRKLSVVKEINSDNLNNNNKLIKTTNISSSSSSNNNKEVEKLKNKNDNNNDNNKIIKKLENNNKFNAIVQFKPQSLIQRKINKNNKKEEEEEYLIKPVPGSWERTPKEQFIYLNKHLIRKSSNEYISHICLINSFISVSSLKFISLIPNKRKTIINNNSLLLPQQPNKTITIIKMFKKLKQQNNNCSFVFLDKQFANKRSFRLGIRKNIILKNNYQRIYLQLNCHSPQLITKTKNFNIKWKEEQRKANVTILFFENYQINKKYLLLKQQKSTKFNKKEEENIYLNNSINKKVSQSINNNNCQLIKQNNENNNLEKPEIVIPLNNNKIIKNPLIPSNNLIKQKNSQNNLILPDKSILEHFVQNKLNNNNEDNEEKEELILNNNKEYNNEQMINIASSSKMSPEIQSLNSSYHSAIQDNFENKERKQPINFGKTKTLLTTNQFEKPKSLFEEKMQKQAIQVHEKAVRQSEENNYNYLRRKSATNENDLIQTFITQAQKPYQQEQRYAAHIALSGRQSTTSCESVNSGSQLVETQENRHMIENSRYKHNQQRNKFKEAIDYLDHIFEDFQRESDQNQKQKNEEKNKLKNEQKEQQKHLVEEFIVKKGNVKSAKEAFEKVAAALANERIISKIKKHPLTPTTSQSSSQQKQQQSSSSFIFKRQQQLPFEKNSKINNKTIIIPSQSIIVENGSNKNKNIKKEEEEEEISVAETIVLPNKNTSDRLDFTRNWLTGSNMSGWAEEKGENSVLPKPYSAKKGIIQDVKDWDEHSLGSCSAEVAAINAPTERRLKQKEKEKQLILIKNKQQIIPLRQRQLPQQLLNNCSSSSNIIIPSSSTKINPPPQISLALLPAAVRPQPVKPQGILPSFGQINKAPSIEQIRFLRAASQDCPPTNMTSSIHSSEGFFNFQPVGAINNNCCLSTNSLQRIGFGGGAFHSYTPTVVQMKQKQINNKQKQTNNNYLNQKEYLKGSIQSLPDSALSQQQQNNNNNYLINNNNYNYYLNNKNQRQKSFTTINQQIIPTDHSLAIDALVAELELDNNINLNFSNEKRRSFPTIQTEINNNNSEILINNIINRPKEERINLSKVNAMTKIFDNNKQNNNNIIKNNNNNKTNPLIFTTNGDSKTNWKTTTKEQLNKQQQNNNIIIEKGPLLKTTKTSINNNNKYQIIKETPPTPPPHSSKHLKQQTIIYKQRQSPQFVKGTKAGIGVFGDRKYIGNKQQQNNNNNNEIEQQHCFNTSNGFYDNVHQQHQGSPTFPSSSSNFRNEDFIDCSSMSSRENELPPHPIQQNNNNGINNNVIPKTAGKRIGQLIKKLGNSVGGDRQQNRVAAVSTLSLNRSAHEQLPSVRNGLGVKEELLTKSNSLSSERWKSQAMAQQQHQNNNLEINQDLIIDENKSHNVGGGLSNRLKQSILGGMVRRRVPT